jgi:hypothetical protein
VNGKLERKEVVIACSKTNCNSIFLQMFLVNFVSIFKVLVLPFHPRFIKRQ